MIGGIVEIADSGRHLSVFRGFLKVSENGTELGRVPLDDITALVLAGPQITLSKTLLVEMAERKTIIVICGRNYHPLSLTIPFDAHHETAGVLYNQIDASEPLKKRLWQRLVKAKIAHQAMVLDWAMPDHPKHNELLILERRVKSGDPENMEAQAARHYWRALMGDDFRRDRYSPDANAYLNYGYTVIRAATARAVCAAGLHPSLGLHHRSARNAFALVDDLMEPFRPLVDLTAKKLTNDDFKKGNSPALTPETKQKLAAILQLDLMSDKGVSPLANCLSRLAQSLVAILTEKSGQLALPQLKGPGILV